MSEPNDPAFYICKGQEIQCQIATRTVAFVRSEYFQVLRQIGICGDTLLQHREASPDAMRVWATNLAIALDSCLTVCASRWNYFPSVEVGPYNRRYLEAANLKTDSRSLVRAIRNGLAHPLETEGLPITWGKVAGKLAFSFFLLRGEDTTIHYDRSLLRGDPSLDACFGVGNFRLSVLGQVLPLLAQLRRLPPAAKVNEVSAVEHEVKMDLIPRREVQEVEKPERISFRVANTIGPRRTSPE